MRGYEATSNSEDAPSMRLKLFNCRSTPSPRSNWKPKKQSPWKGVKAPHAIGRNLVLCTFWSMSRSRRSFTVQPDPRKSKAPSPNNDNILTSGRFPGGAAKAMDHIQGHANNQVPMGLSKRAKWAYGLNRLGKYKSIHDTMLTSFSPFNRVSLDAQKCEVV